MTPGAPEQQTMEERHLSSIDRWNLALGVIAVVISLLFGDARVFYGTAAGAALAILNFHVVHRVVRAIARRTAPGAAKQSLGPLVAVLLAKMTLLIAAVWAVARKTDWNIVGFMIGLGIFLISIFIVSARFMSSAEASQES